MAFTHPTIQKLLTTTPSHTITPPPAYVHDPTLNCTVADFEDDDDDDDNDDVEQLSSIHLKISNPIIVNGDNNLVAIDPFFASKIAMTVVQALKQMSMGESGVPMIDEDGKPRPIKVDVAAELKIKGSRNVVGERAVLELVASREVGLRKASSSSSGGSEVGSIDGKRQRAESEPLEGRGKRVKTE